MKHRSHETAAERTMRIHDRTAKDLATTTLLWALALGVMLAGVLIECLRQDWFVAIIFACVAVMHHQMMQDSVRLEHVFRKRAR